MTRAWLFALVVIGTNCWLAGAVSAQRVWTSPINPTVADSVKVSVSSGFPMTGCWQLGEVSCVRVPPDTLAVTVVVGYCHGQPGCMCAAFPMTYVRTCNFGLLPEGPYVAKFTELHVSSYDTIATFSRTTPFAVTGTTPVRLRSWGVLKSIYR